MFIFTRIVSSARRPLELSFANLQKRLMADPDKVRIARRLRGKGARWVLRWAYWWTSTEESPDDVTTDQVLVKLNTDFSTKGLGPQEIQAIVAAWQAGAISRDTMTDLFRRGEALLVSHLHPHLPHARHLSRRPGSRRR